MARAWPSGSAAGGTVDAVLDVAGKTPVEELISLVPEPSQVVTIANYAAGQAGARVTGGGADSRPMEALALTADLLAQNKLVIKVQTFPFNRAAEATASARPYVRGSRSWSPDGSRPPPKRSSPRQLRRPGRGAAPRDSGRGPYREPCQRQPADDLLRRPPHRQLLLDHCAKPWLQGQLGRLGPLGMTEGRRVGGLGL